MWVWIIVVIVVIVVGLLAYVRLAPVDVAHWHAPMLPTMAPGEYPGTGRFTGQYVLEGDGRDVLARLNDVALATPRTQVIAGSVEEGRITYQTRSRLMGFPDYTTVTLTQLPQAGSATLQIFARLRFGKDDMGVNEARARDWVKRAGITGD